ncbi:MAG TPA: class I SAM-dependent methyltransferase [Pirellulales bacterium]|nr:class I SAM-dependent methyltransferase [Pirellulales bacterium]
MRTHFNLSAAEYEACRSGAVEQRRRRLVRAEIDALSGIKRTVELGCGPGRFLAELAHDYPHIEFTGIDINPGMIEHAQRRYQTANLRYELLDITTSDHLTGMDFAFSIDVLHHIHDLATFFQAVHRSMCPAGVWLAIEPNVYHPYIYYSQERMRRAGFDEDHFRPWVAEPLLARAGFTISRRGFVSIFPGAIRRLPRPLEWFEQCCENWPFLGGSVVYRLISQINSGCEAPTAVLAALSPTPVVDCGCAAAEIESAS